MIDMAVATIPRRELPVAEPPLWKLALVRRFLLLQGAGQVADAMISLALAQVVVFQLERGASPGTIAKLLITATLPYVIIGPIAGVVSDRWSRRRSLAITSTVRAALALCAIAVPITHSRLLGYSTASCLLAAGGLAFTLRSSSIPHLVEPRRLVAMNSTVGLVQKTSGTIGFGLGALCLAFSPILALGVGIALHLVAACGYRGYPTDLGGGTPRAVNAPSKGAVARRVVRLATTSPTRGAISAIVVHRLLFGAAFGSFVLLADARYDLSASSFALAIGITATGAFVGTLLVVPITSFIGRRATVFASFLLCTSMMLFGGFSGESWAVMAAMIVASFCFQTVRLISDSTVQGHIVDDALGRVFGGYDTLCNLAYVTGVLIRVFLFSTSSPLAFAVIAGAYLLATAIPLSSLTMNQMSMNQMSTNQMSTNQMTTNQMSTNQMSLANAAHSPIRRPR